MGLFFDIAFAATKAASSLTDKSGEAAETLSDKIAALINFILGRIPLWIAAGIVFVASIGIARMVKSAVESRISEKIDEEHQEILVLAGRISYVTTLAIGFTTALKIAGIDLTTILAAVAFGIGFALRDLIMNFLAGIMILINRQFSIGDFIKVGDVTGKVVEIQSRATILKATDGTKIILPNSEIFSNAVISYTSNPMRRVVVPLYVAYGTNLDYAMKIALNVFKKHPKILKKPKPSVIVKDYGDSEIDLAGRFWVPTSAGWVKVRSEIMKLMDKAFTEAGIDCPYNVVHVENEQDTAGWNKQMEAAQKAMKEKMEAEENAAKTASVNGNGAGQIPAQAEGNGAATSAQSPSEQKPALPPAVPIAPVLQTAPVMSSVGAPVPEGVFADEAEADEQTMDNVG